MLDKLNNHWANATTMQIKEGMSWYQRANRECKRISKKHRIVLWKVVGVMAALSPNNKWENNIKDCEKLIADRNHRPSTYGNQRLKALAILKLRLRKKVPETLSKPNNRKTRHFYHNMLNPYSSQKVTIDLHAMRSIEFTGSLTKKKYNEITKVHQDLARSKGLLPHQLQAVIWSVVRSA